MFDQHSWHDRTSINGLRSVMLMNHKKLLPVSWAAEHIETSARIQAVDGRRLS
ncbi:hypothetical protein JV074_004939 [Escherichia coli]|nr:hypothetical protein [Escherichia coli O25]EHB8334333.1 hypothetical protein [Escherichia coli]EHW64175.1 hypothetical protein ECDEC9E_0615 [Escherichia coli DEC9E]EJT7458764.1 hypothetical protein [Escherichia coli]HBA7358394.1 hypothetical protein [Escherichia coli]